MRSLAPIGSVYQAGTLSGNPVSLAAGIATLKVLKSHPPYKTLDALGQTFARGLDASGVDCARAQQMGGIVWLHLDGTELPRRADRISKDAMERFLKIHRPLLEKGFYLPPSPYEVMFLSRSHSYPNVIGLVTAIVEELKKLESS